MLNRFSQYCSLFINYTGSDLLCMNRQDLIDLCGHADGIRLYNSVQSRTLKTLYVRFKAEDKGQSTVPSGPVHDCLFTIKTVKIFILILAHIPLWLFFRMVIIFSYGYYFFCKLHLVVALAFSMLLSYPFKMQSIFVHEFHPLIAD